jgi:endogenous inhibitor of DNA gyrase (YacG/DUF329 family)
MKHRCPICKKPTDSELHPDFPFCGGRCRLLDLGAWSSEKYIVSEPIFDEEELANPDRSAPDRRNEANETIH